MTAVLHFPTAEQYPSITATVSALASNLISGILEPQKAPQARRPGVEGPAWAWREKRDGMSGGLATTARLDPESVRADGLEELLPRLRDAFGAPLGDAPSGQVAHARCGGSPAKPVDDGVRVGFHGQKFSALNFQAQAH